MADGGLELNIISAAPPTKVLKPGRSVKRKAKEAAQQKSKRSKPDTPAHVTATAAAPHRSAEFHAQSRSPSQQHATKQPSAVKRDYKTEKLQRQANKPKAIKAVNGVVDFYKPDDEPGKAGAKQRRKRARTPDLVVPASQSKVRRSTAFANAAAAVAQCLRLILLFSLIFCGRVQWWDDDAASDDDFGFAMGGQTAALDDTPVVSTKV